VLDFDGVLCDSTPECVVTAWNTWQDHFAHCPNEVPVVYRTAVEEGRNYVKTAGEYLILLESACDSIPIVSQEDYDSAFQKHRCQIAAFAERFFIARDRLRREDENHWIALHEIYEGIPESLRQGVSNMDCYIVTGKDACSVKLFLQKMDVGIPDARIYDKDAAHDKLSAIRTISENSNVPLSSIALLDDNVNHLLPALDAGCYAAMAGWGYHSEEHLKLAKTRGIPVLGLSNWINAFMEWKLQG